MQKRNILSIGVNLVEAVKAGQVVSLSGKLADSLGDQDAMPAGIAQDDGEVGQRIALTIIGSQEVSLSDPRPEPPLEGESDSEPPAHSLTIGSLLAVQQGNLVPHVKGSSFGVVASVTGNRAEVLLGTGIGTLPNDKLIG